MAGVSGDGPGRIGEIVLHQICADPLVRRMGFQWLNGYQFIRPASIFLVTVADQDIIDVAIPVDLLNQPRQMASPS